MTTLQFLVWLLKLIGFLILIIIAIPVGWLAFSYTASLFFPPYTFSAVCTYDLTYRLTLTIDVGGKQYTSEVVHQQSRSREWISVMNSSGCQQTYGTAVPFRLADDRLILLRSHICGAAQRQFREPPNYGKPNVGRYYSALKEREKDPFARAMAEHRKIDVVRYCAGISRDRYLGRFTDGFVIDNADRPTRWKGFQFGDSLSESDEVIRLIAATAEAADIWPADDLDRIAPAVLRTNFKNQSWSDSPEAILSFSRRYNLNKKFAHQAGPY